ncbi:YhdB family protein [Bacillus taeanensis]|uniref:Uncharacterized protein n=1 Tax=Bacillus taeanensis TaxID=273032 RepID=A0A366XWE9_9BACI|nr:YhdB family protein [Bacillus taeanensis]RBW69485.1 hypothetical protein DS031_11215 [Bacillus taeanensis]
MDITDYDKTLYYLHRLDCYELLNLMSRTDDDLLSKKIEKFVQSYMHEPQFFKVKKTQESLLVYLDHCFSTTPVFLEQEL